jgi:hypothetical protein
VSQQVNLLKSQPNFLLWYSADEPDGQVQPLNSTKLANDLIKALDPYHPVSLALNCENYYFEEYSSGADIILSDVYPIAVNRSWSVVYDAHATPPTGVANVTTAMAISRTCQTDSTSSLSIKKS